MGKKVLHVFANLNRGGAESRIMDVYRYIDRNYVQFDFLVMEHGEHHFDEEIQFLGGKKYLVRDIREKGILANMIDIYKCIKGNGPYHAVHAHTAHHEGIVLLIARLAGIKKRVAHARTTSTQNANSIIKLFCVHIGRYLIRLNATNFLAISNEAACYVFGKKILNKCNYRVIPNAIDLSLYLSTNIYNVENIRRELGVPEDAFIIVHVGRLSKVKNQRFLIDVFYDIQKEKKDSFLVLIGDGEDRKFLEDYAKILNIQNYIKFLGVRDDVPALLSCFDVFVMPSLYEGLGGAAIEAQAAGLPCVLSDTIPKIVDMELGLTSFLSLHDGIYLWADKILQYNNKSRPSKAKIKEAFYKKQFLLENEIIMLMDEYGITYPMENKHE